MAITINTNPATGSSVHDNMWHVVSSDNSGQIDFKYVFDVWINGVQKIRVKQFPEPDSGKGYFDAGPIVRNSMTYSWFEPVTSSMLVAQPGMAGEMGIVYALRVGEDYSGLTTTNMASGEISGFNWAPPMFGRRVVTLSDKVNKFFTNRPAYANTKIGENLYIGFYLNTPASTTDFNVERFDQSNASLGTTTSVISISNQSQFLQLNIGTAAIAGTLSLIITDAVKYYDVWINGQTANKIRVYVTCNPKYTCIPIHFLNRWGMYDTLRFDLVSKLSMDITRKDFGKRDFQFNGNSVDYKSSSNRYYEGRINYSNKAMWTYKLTADALTDDEWEWVADLFTSPQILMEVAGYFYPVTVKKTSYDYNKFVNDRLKALEIEFEMNSARMTQLR